MRHRPAPRCHLFCRVIDNFGDAGVCWRLAKQLASEFGWRVRLIIDDVAVLRRIVPRLETQAEVRSGPVVEVVSWPVGEFVDETGDVVIEAFACRLPGPYLAAMANRPTAPVWVNLEYLSAEKWVEACHGLPSPDPSSALVKHFFFPGFTPGTGGLIHSEIYSRTAAGFDSREARWSFLASIGAPALTEGDFPVSVFCYPASPLRSLIAMAGSTIPDGRRPIWLVSEASERGTQEFAASLPRRIVVLPMLDQDDYDRLLLSCDLNFVRGEDSFVRAQLAARPFVWQAYRQSEGAHRDKVDAFLSIYLAEARADTEIAIRSLFLAWNGFEDFDASNWHRYAMNIGNVADHSRHWLRHLESMPNLAENLVNFCESRL